jgi:AraC-like DNA-binding protein
MMAETLPGNSANPEAGAGGVFRYSAIKETLGTAAVNGLTCFVQTASHSSASELEVHLPRHFFFCTLHGQRDEIVKHSWNGSHLQSRRMTDYESSLLVPEGQRFVSQRTGHASHRYVICEIEHSTFARVLGEQARDFELRPHFARSPIRSGIAERLESLCLDPDALPLAYAESLAAILVVELFEAFGTKAISQPKADAEAKRFQPVLDFVEESLDRDVGLFELASLTGLSVTHFAHAFKATYGVSPYRYILQRRVERAKILLRTSEDTIAAIAARIGFSSQSRFSQTFASVTGVSPSACRSTPE